MWQDRIRRLSRPELAALQAIGRGATQLKMGLRMQARLLELGLIHRPGHSFRVTDAGLRVLRPQRANSWL